MSKKKDIIRVGDTVKIINPTTFIRCGYETCIAEEKEKVLAENIDDIKSFLRSCKVCVEPEKTSRTDELLKWTLTVEKSISDYKLEIAYDRIAREIAYLKIAQDGIKGEERKLYVKVMPDIQGEVLMVRKIKFVKTGIRQSSYSGQDSYSGEYEYTSGYLGNEKTHKILTLGYVNPFMIEAINVEKVIEETKVVDKNSIEQGIDAIDNLKERWYHSNGMIH